MPTITIAGGGVAGLALAATLDPTQYRVRLIERRPGSGRLPTSFGIWPFALKALAGIGLDGALRERGLRLTSGVITANSAALEENRRRTMTQRADVWLITRPALLDVLDSAVPDTVEREQYEAQDVAALDGDLLVAADGARSTVRGQIWRDQPRDTGVFAMRGVLPTPPGLPGGQMREYWGDGMLVGVGPNPLPDGTGTNWYVSARGRAGTAAEMLAWAQTTLAGFPAIVRDTLAAAEQDRTVVHSILESRHPHALVRGRHVLIGDAAHAMSPNLGRGACEAIADAIALGSALNEDGIGGVGRYARTRLRAGQRTRLGSAMARRLALSARIGPVVVGLAGWAGRTRTQR